MYVSTIKLDWIGLCIGLIGKVLVCKDRQLGLTSIENGKAEKEGG